MTQVRDFGALVAFELARALPHAGQCPPRHLFVSGARAPHLWPDREIRHQLPTDHLLEHLGKLGGAPRAVLEDREHVELLLPTIRAGLEASDRYYTAPAEGAMLDCPITAFAGRDDPLAPIGTTLEWRRCSSRAFDLEVFPGGHFFIGDHMHECLDELTARLALA